MGVDWTRIWVVSVVVLPLVGLAFVFALAFAFGFALVLVGFGLLADGLGKDVGNGDWVLEDLLGGLFEGDVVPHPHRDSP